MKDSGLVSRSFACQQFLFHRERVAIVALQRKRPEHARAGHTQIVFLQPGACSRERNGQQSLIFTAAFDSRGATGCVRCLSSLRYRGWRWCHLWCSRRCVCVLRLDCSLFIGSGCRALSGRRRASRRDTALHGVRRALLFASREFVLPMHDHQGGRNRHDGHERHHDARCQAATAGNAQRQRRLPRAWRGFGWPSRNFRT